ncbi:MAG: 5'-methylthioadenosine/S-adenosylhomocysteine nucleosidase [Spirochaetes bacterium]|nr:5'-methylthioadenosine/S-adenosylhomocysteine nucleosidase [Spirochaetota bacterium]
MSRNILVLQFATQLEAKPFIEALRLSPLQQKPFVLYRGDSSLYAIIGGIGITSAAIAATFVYTTLNADKILNIGAAGALTPSLPLGTIGTVTTVFDTTRFDFDTEKPFTYALPPMDTVIQLTCVSVTKPLRTCEERDRFAPTADIVDMELAGIARASQKFSKLCYAIKYISDTPQHNTHEDIVQNIITLSQSTAPEIVAYIQSLIAEYS